MEMNHVSFVTCIDYCIIFSGYDSLSVLLVGANSSLTAAAVVVTGLIGANFVQATLDKLRFRDPIARGIATASRYVPQQSLQPVRAHHYYYA